VAASVRLLGLGNSSVRARVAQPFASERASQPASQPARETVLQPSPNNNDDDDDDSRARRNHGASLLLSVLPLCGGLHLERRRSPAFSGAFCGRFSLSSSPLLLPPTPFFVRNGTAAAAAAAAAAGFTAVVSYACFIAAAGPCRSIWLSAERPFWRRHEYRRATSGRRIPGTQRKRS